MNDEPAHVPAKTWRAAAQMVSFRPRTLLEIKGHGLQQLSVHVRNHKGELPIASRSIVARYTGFTFTQARKTQKEALRWALAVNYGQNPMDVVVAGHKGRMYELGPEVAEDDIDGRAPSVVTWSDGEILYFFASCEMPVSQLRKFAERLYAG